MIEHDRMGNIMVEYEQAKIVIRVQPNTRRNQVMGLKDGIWQLRIAAHPIKGQANQELIKFLSDILGVSKSNLTLEKGMTSKTKTVAIKGLSQNQVMIQLERQ
ncbi:DUF167 domain-containing protein [Chloroflexota bacterium]